MYSVCSCLCKSVNPAIPPPTPPSSIPHCTPPTECQSVFLLSWCKIPRGRFGINLCCVWMMLGITAPKFPHLPPPPFLPSSRPCLPLPPPHEFTFPPPVFLPALAKARYWLAGRVRAGPRLAGPRTPACVCVCVPLCVHDTLRTENCRGRESAWSKTQPLLREWFQAAMLWCLIE